jgi:glycosyl transferase family 25
LIARATQKCLDRDAAVLHSIHYGTAAYIINRETAAALLEQTQTLDLTADFAVFNKAAIRRYYPIYQICPALCVQGTNLKDGIAFAEMNSTSKPPHLSERKPIGMKIRLEITRPFLQLGAVLNNCFKEKWLRARRGAVPFA